VSCAALKALFCLFVSFEARASSSGWEIEELMKLKVRLASLILKLTKRIFSKNLLFTDLKNNFLT
jgi:hypothetical protein